MSKRTAKERSRESFDRQARAYDRTVAGKHARPLRMRALAEYAKRSRGPVLDVGCGPGDLLTAASEISPTAKLYGLDLSPEMIRVARQRLGRRAELVVGDAEELPWPDEHFEVALCIDSLHHYPEPVKALFEMHRVLKPSGRLILGDVWLPAVLRQLANLFLPLGREGDVRIYGEKEVRAMLFRAGFKKMTWEAISRTAYIAIAKL